MGKQMYCDLCRADVPIEENFQKIVVGETIVAEVCITCGTKVASGVKSSVMEASKQVAAAQAAVQSGKLEQQAAADLAAKEQAEATPPEAVSRDGPATPGGQ